MGDAQNSDQQPRGRPFAKGGDPRINKGGRPKGYNAFRKAFRGKEDIAAIRTRLMGIILSTAEGGESIAAAKLWLEYGFGKTPAAPEDNDALRESGRPLKDASDEDILAALRGKP